MVIGIDFDGTCVTNEYPHIGKDIGAIPVLKALVNKDHKLILITMRQGTPLKEAINWFTTNAIPLYSVNNNPTQSNWSLSRKIYANYYIDDANLCTPLITTNGKPYIDWVAVHQELINKKIL